MSIEKDCKYCCKVLACKGYDKSSCLIQDQKDFELDEELFEKYIRKDEREKLIDRTCETCYYLKIDECDHSKQCMHKNAHSDDSWYLWNYSIEKKCENCKYNEKDTIDCDYCDIERNKFSGFYPSEKAIRENERDRILDLIFKTNIYPKTNGTKCAQDLIYKKIKSKEIEIEFG